jgi:hypothetical protein
MAIDAVQIRTKRAFSLVPTKVLTFKENQMGTIYNSGKFNKINGPCVRIILFLSILFVLTAFGNNCLAGSQTTEGILESGLSAISHQNPEAARLFKNALLEEAKEGKFTGPSHSMKITQTFAMYRGYYFLEIKKRFPNLFTKDERDKIVEWFARLTERAFTVEWSDLYYALAFWKPITAPYRNQENGTGALVIYAEIIKDKYPGLARKAINYVKENAVMWGRNFRNTDDSVHYQVVWIYNCYNVAKYLFPEWLANENSKRSFDWIMYQWPPDGAPFGYNPFPGELHPDIMYLGAKIHKDGAYKWLGDRMLAYAHRHEINLSGFRPGMAFDPDDVQPSKPEIGSTYLEGPGNLVQFPSESRPDKIVFREGWDKGDFFAILNLRFDGWHGYKGTNSFISIRFGAPFVVEDLMNKSLNWLPKGRAKRRDENICRSRFNGFQLEGGVFRKLVNTVLGFENSWIQNVPKFAEVEDFATSKKIDFSRTTLPNWNGWKNTRVCILVKEDYFAVLDFNFSNKPNKHAISWHLRGDLENTNEKVQLKQDNYEVDVFLLSDHSELKIKSSKENYPPENEAFEASYDLLLQGEKMNSEMISLFWPKRNNGVIRIKKHEESDTNYMIITVETNAFDDLIMVKKSNDDMIVSYNGAQSDSDLFIIRTQGDDTIAFYNRGSFLEYKENKFKFEGGRNSNEGTVGKIVF